MRKKLNLFMLQLLIYYILEKEVSIGAQGKHLTIQLLRASAQLLVTYVSFHSVPFIVCIGVSTSPQKHPHPLFLAKPPPSPLNLQAVQVSPFLGNLPPLYRFFMNSPVKVRFFSECAKYQNFLSILSFKSN